jgi:hypothetical protein
MTPEEQKAAGAFRELCAVLDSVPPESRHPDGVPLRGVIPEGGPTVGDLRALASLLVKLPPAG